MLRRICRRPTTISIEAARLNLEKTRRDYERSLQLFNEKLISQELFDDTKTAHDLAKNTLQKVEKELGLVEYQLTKTKILAPFDCTILTRPVSVGQAVSGSGGVAGGTEVLTIANLNEMVINAHVNQADVSRLKPEQQVEVQVEAVTGLKVIGKVERVAPQATIKNNIKGFATRILLRDVDKRIRPGMTANIKIPVASRDNVLAVPLAAVFTEQNEETQQNERFVYVKKDDTYERRPVQIGVSDFFYAEVVKGLSADEVVALELPKDELHRNISSRVESMMEKGLLEEVIDLSSFKQLNALQTVGYKELFAHLDGATPPAGLRRPRPLATARRQVSLQEAITQIKTSTRQYAKRQMTWFKKDRSIYWFPPDNVKGIISLISRDRSFPGKLF